MVFRYGNGRHSVYQLRDEMDRLLSGVFRAAPFVPTGRYEGPAVNVWEENDSLKVEMEVPGVNQDHLDISVVEGELLVKVEVPEGEGEGVTYHRRERPVGSFSRAVPLPFEIDAENVTAELSRGVLEITLPKAPNSLPRKIDVKVKE